MFYYLSAAEAELQPRMQWSRFLNPSRVGILFLGLDCLKYIWIKLQILRSVYDARAYLLMIEIRPSDGDVKLAAPSCFSIRAGYCRHRVSVDHYIVLRGPDYGS